MPWNVQKVMLMDGYSASNLPLNQTTCAYTEMSMVSKTLALPATLFYIVHLQLTWKAWFDSIGN